MHQLVSLTMFEYLLITNKYVIYMCYQGVRNSSILRMSLKFYFAY